MNIGQQVMYLGIAMLLISPVVMLMWRRQASGLKVLAWLVAAMLFVIIGGSYG